MKAKLILKDGMTFDALSFGAPVSSAGEVVFSTGMMGYPEGLTDPSFTGQILTLTYPLIGNYGVPSKHFWEADRLMVSGLIVSEYIDTPSHFQSKSTLAKWFKDEKIPLIQIKDTRALTQHIRDSGSLLGKIIIDPFEKTLGHPEQGRTDDNEISYYDPNTENLVAKVSTQDILTYPSHGKKAKRIVLIDCGAKRNIIRALSSRDVDITVVPWNYDFLDKKNKELVFDGIIISNGPGDPKFVQETITIIKKALAQKIPTLGICLGNQVLTLAAGGDTEKLKYGHRSQNQPCIMVGTKRCYITTQNHGFAVSRIPAGFKPWFINANDNSNEGIIHTNHPFMSVQFHPEATPGPHDTEWIFDYFLERI